MLNKFAKMCTILAFLFGAHSATADSWTLDTASSRLAFGSVKKDVIGEVHSFTGLTGTVDSSGAVNVEIDLTSVETNIDIRNERMGEHVFKGLAAATLAAEIDMEMLKDLAVGTSTTFEVDAVLGFLGQDVDVYAEMFVIRLSETQVMVTTNDMLYVETADLGINAGLDKLMELAELPGITRTVPVTLRLMFNMDEKKALAAPAAPAPNLEILHIVDVQATGDAAAGKDVFKKCRACHKVEEGRNGVGPSLYGIMDRPAGNVDGFAYSDAMASSGLTWDSATMAAFLAKPKDIVPGTKMAFRGLRRNDEIANLIAYLGSL